MTFKGMSEILTSERDRRAFHFPRLFHFFISFLAGRHFPMSTLFLSFGPNSGMLTGHCLNSLIECPDLPPTWYTESYTGLLPNAVFFDNAKSVHLYLDEEVDDLSKYGKVERISEKEGLPITIPRFKPTPFVEYVKNGGKTVIPLDQPRPDLHLDDVTLTWSDIVNFNLTRRSYYEIPGTDVEPLETYLSGIERLNDSQIYEGMTEPIRHSLEGIDRMSCVIATIDRNTGYGGVYERMTEYLSEEVPKAVQLSFSMADEITSDAVACNACLSLSSCLNHASMHTVLVMPEELPAILNPDAISASNVYQRTALFSVPLTSIVLPIVQGVTDARTVVNTVSPTSVLKFTSLSSAFPYYDPLVDWSFKAEERIYTRYSIMNGVPNESAQKMIDETLKPESPFFYAGVRQQQPVFVGLTMPHFFKDGVITATGDRPSVKPPGLSDEDYQRLVQFKVITVRPPVDCAFIRTLSTAGCLSTSRSLAQPLENAVQFIRNAPAITKEMVSDDAQAAAEVVLNVIDGLKEEQ